MNGNNSYQIIRAIRGPITLITLGALFALQNFTRFGFDQTWPVLLIVFGLLSLMQRGAAPPRATQMPPGPPPPPRGYTATSYSGSSYSQPPAGGNPPTSGSSTPGGTA
jgi:hypothetical protein